ncbi:MAG TPA: DmsC/YnfH family molybdoenzyme membrane anchor subunit [Paracoccaceae bacterium]|nr:DmsC/YnfH family molybdoenzyme membrane anchor subunit [Paracoccaceae bacterium]
MHPAPSVIVFTALSGLGFGLLAWLGIGMPASTGMTAFAFYFIGYALAVGGLLASTFHLGNPKNAPKAFSQWRTSWLSREGIVSVAALLTIAPYAIGRIFLDADWALLGYVGAALSLITVFCTSMIYAQLRTVPRWHTPTTPALLLMYSISGGALLAGQVSIAGWLILLLGALQMLAWVQGDKAYALSCVSMETATGLGHIGKVRQLEPPHSGTNYLLKEMVFQVGRKHAQKLRVISILALSFVPALLIIGTNAGHVFGALALLIHITGVFAARWLFFAEAQHVVKEYYGK